MVCLNILMKLKCQISFILLTFKNVYIRIVTQKELWYIYIMQMSVYNKTNIRIKTFIILKEKYYS